MRGVHIFEKPCYREIRVMRGRAMRGLPVHTSCGFLKNKFFLEVILNNNDTPLCGYNSYMSTN